MCCQLIVKMHHACDAILPLTLIVARVQCNQCAPQAEGKERHRLQSTASSIWCYACSADLMPQGVLEQADAGVVVRCTECNLFFCYDCDSYIHESLHNCPGCEVAGTDDRFDESAPMIE